ncbi:MAG TPA: copper homeostasis protein CutC [Bacteroidales bacterium]|jgi:copper homeostasis protein|nr:copper homeostasis protein CutC [Bacteroidales bacterium]HKM12641.1 copper homeostasis protein CutC [Bacteroidales bacterium]HPB88942.1 copper homeostasis protein CutC [Bacteroidales bacterium]HPY22540.1 copper homeostasis protein CutC [Bacteroidales bacterium]HQA93781.1 copper homeostasis protein CutC [Bacteroidales bacterium]
MTYICAMLIEICSENIDIALKAQKKGALRVELCNNISIGGVTPSYDEIEQARRQLNIGLNVLIRPRGGDFCYSAAEISRILRDIEFCGSLITEEGKVVDGVVIGALARDRSIEYGACSEMFAAACEYGLSTTFHRAIDRSRDIFKALERVIDLGVNRVLTSGGAESAFEGRKTIAQMVQLSVGSGTLIMAGAGITPENAGQIIAETSVPEIHGSRLSLLDGFV